MAYSGEETSTNFNKEYADILDLIAAHNYTRFSRGLLQSNKFTTGVDEDGFSLMYYAIQNLSATNPNPDAIKIIKALAITYKNKGVDPMFQGTAKVTDVITMSGNHPVLKQLITEGVFRKEGGRRRKSKRSKRKARKTRRR